MAVRLAALVLELLLLQQLLARQDDLVDEQLAQLVCDGVVACALLLLLGTADYALDLLPLALQVRLALALVGAQRAAVVPRLVLGVGLPRGRLSQPAALDRPEVWVAGLGALLGPRRLQQPVLDGPELEHRGVLDLVDLDAVGVLAQLEERVLRGGRATLTMRLLMRPS